jgi:hypothetical protein
LDGQTVTIQQGFKVTIDSVDAGQFDVYTAGRMQLPGELPPISFKGKGNGTAEEISKGIYDVTMDLSTRTKRGGKLIFALIARINIDHTSAGFMSGYVNMTTVKG